MHTLGRVLLCLIALAPVACARVRSDPEKATRPYPFWLRQGETLPIQVLTRGENVVIVNATTREFRDIDLWLNERYVMHVEVLAAGEIKSVHMGDFWDVRGEGPNPGGLFRYYDPTPVRLLQVQTDQHSPLLGLLAVLPESEID